MERQEIFKELEGYSYTLEGNYAVVEIQGYTDEGEEILPFDVSTALLDHYAEAMQGGRRVAVIKLDEPYEDEEDVASSIKWCECQMLTEW